MEWHEWIALVRSGGHNSSIDRHCKILFDAIWLSKIWISILMIVSQIDNGLAFIQVSSSWASGGLREILYTFEKCNKASSCFGKYQI